MVMMGLEAPFKNPCNNSWKSYLEASHKMLPNNHNFPQFLLAVTILAIHLCQKALQNQPVVLNANEIFVTRGSANNQSMAPLGII